MRRFGIGLALVCLCASGCSKQPTAATTPPMQAAPADNAVAPQDTTTQVAVAEEPADPNRPWIAAATASEYMLIGQSEQTFGVWVDVPKGAGGHVPTALSLAIDTSGSMRGEKIIHARDAARRLIEELEDGDIVSLVTFSGQAHLLRSPTVIDDHRRRDLLNLVEELTAEGGTAMHDGLKVAEGQLWQTPDTHLVRRMVVISDGKATVGVTARHTLGNVAEVGLQKSIQVTALGVGVDYDELTLNELAVRSSGRLYHVEESSELPAIVEEEMALLESTAAADVAVELVAAPGVHIVGTDIAHATRQGGGLAVPLGTMFGGQQRELLVRARVDDNAVEGSKVLASVRLHFRDPAEGGVARVQEAVLRATVTDDPGLVAEHTNSRTQTLIAVREVSDWTQQASQELNRGDLDAADVQLARAESRMREQERRATTKADKARARSSAAKIAQQRSSVKKAKAKPAKARKKASRKLSLDANADAMSAFGY